MNSLFAFILHVFLLKLQSMFAVPLANGTMDNFRVASTDYLFGSFSSQNAALYYSLCFLGLNFFSCIPFIPL